jgi:mono/diheme cytochrome c family protein
VPFLGKFQHLCRYAGWLLAATTVLGCGGESNLHAGHDSHGAESGAVCPEGSDLSYESFGAAFMTRYCVDCHSSARLPAEREGAPFGTDYDSLEALYASGIEHVDYVAAAGPAHANAFMPPPTFSRTPTEEERLVLGQWIACGAP